ncbi:MAG TPA: glycogen synthase [Thermoanaerobaculia bacterium]|nr:glycogen synthase [Thermoanaerobaculia bacterium]
MRVLFLAAEAAPLVKVGGLGDVAGSLPRALAALGIDVRVAIPDARPLEERRFVPRPVATFSVSAAHGDEVAAVSEVDVDGFPFLLVGGAPIPRSGRVYGNGIGEDGPKFAFFCRAALELCRRSGWKPDLVHAHDSHAAPAAAWLSEASGDPFFRDTASLVTIHNLPYMGTGAGAALADYGIPVDGDGLPEWARGALLPVGIARADEISTVSPTYAREILTPEYGCGLDALLRSRADRLTGIVNGLDLTVWDPSADSALARRFDAARIDARDENRDALRRDLGLESDPAAPLVGIVSRLDDQKGFDVAAPALARWLASGGQLAALGTGDPAVERGLGELAAAHPSRAAVRFRFDADLARRIYAGADMFLIPSRYEPCGLTQMIAMRYGCVPVARETGGLADTIRDAAGSAGTGFLFPTLDPDAISGALERARALRGNRPAWRSLVLRGMAEDFSWTRSARAYDALYVRAAARRRETVAR